MKKILINASNLHNGGGIQVATSFLSELSDLNLELNFEIFVYVSSVVDENLKSTGFEKNKFKNYKVLNIFGIRALDYRVAKDFFGFDLTFTIFGPLYSPKKIPNHLIGFAQSWILMPKNEISERLKFFRRASLRLKFLIQWIFFKVTCSRLIVELDHVKRKLVDFKKFPEDKIDVVFNCVSSIYMKEAKWLGIKNLKTERSDQVIRLGYISRAYPHKNLDILLDVAENLKKITKSKFEFYVTLTDNEWANFSPGFRSEIKNLGAINVAQCPTFYQSMDGVIFTSLMECFSATPLEAMIMRRPLFASDRDFVRDCCADHAIYINPLDPIDIAKKINDWFSFQSKENQAQRIEQAYKHVASLPNSRDRAISYINIIKKQLQS